MPAQFPYPQQSVLGGPTSAMPGAAPTAPDATGAEGPAPPEGPVPTEPMAAAGHHMKLAMHHMGRAQHHMGRAGKGGGGKKK
jgi:hypothetical protein